MNKRIMNIVNFVRGIEPRSETDLYTPVVKQLETDKKYGIPSTYLLQYDAMRREDFRALFRGDVCAEKGVWLENCRELIEKVGLTWRGRAGYDWDWFVNVGFLMGYTPKQREAIIDEVFGCFKELFGYFPEVVGSWLIDAYSMRYMYEKYNVRAFCICREQWAVDAYSLWGGFFNGGYYPSVNNMLCPAQSPENQIGAPVFRMLGPDPIYSYDELKYKSGFTSGCWTMEPAWQSGQSSEIIDWYFKEYYTMPCLSFAHATTGQENSFGWQTFGNGYVMQIEKLATLREKGIVSILTLGETAKDFCKAYPSTPPQVLAASDDWAGNGIRTSWYNCINYRANIFLFNGKLFFRDINVFNDEYRERYLDTPCTDWQARYDNLPVVDSRLWSKDGKECGLFLTQEVRDISLREESDEKLTVDVQFADKMGMISFSPDGIEFRDCGALEYRVGAPEDDARIALRGNVLEFTHNGFDYTVHIDGKIRQSKDGFTLYPSGNVLKINL